VNEQVLKNYTQHIETEVTQFLKSIDEEQLNRARQLIGAAKEQHGRLHITGIGKPSHVAEYMCALFSSTGTPCYFLDGTEAVHGSAGQVLPEDVVIAISNSGNTIELRNTVEALQRMGVKIISVTGNLSSWLAKNTEAVLFAGVQNEGDDTNKPPRLSIVAEIIVLQCLSILLQEDTAFTMEKYAMWHPGGALGAQIREEIGHA